MRTPCTTVRTQICVGWVRALRLCQVDGAWGKRLGPAVCVFALLSILHRHTAQPPLRVASAAVTILEPVEPEMGLAFSAWGKPARNDDDIPWLEVLGNPEYLDWRRGASDLSGLPLSQEDQSRIEKEQSLMPIHMHDFIYLADARSAARIGRVKYMGITHVLNLAGVEGSPKKTTFAEAGMVYKMIDAKDREGYQILDKHLLEARGFIASARSHGGKCLVYCLTGYDVSGVIVAAEVMLSQKISVLEVVANFRKRRGNALLQNASFQQQLVALARTEDLLGPKPGQPGSIIRELTDAGGVRRSASVRRNSGGSMFSAASGRSFRSKNSSKASSVSQSSFRTKVVGESFDKSFKKKLKETDSFILKRTAPNELDMPYLEVMRDPEFLDWRNRPDPATGRVPDDDEQERIEKEQGNMPVQISENVFLADARAVKKIGRLKFMGITHVLNVAGPEGAPSSSETFAEAQILYRMIDARDRDGYPVLMRHLTEARDFIGSARAGGGRCLVYCMTGYDLSGVIVAADKMLTETMTVLGVLAHCRRRRGNAFLSSEGFQEQLIALARAQGLLGSKPGSPESLVPNVSTRRRSDGAGVVGAMKRAISFNNTFVATKPTSPPDLRAQVAHGIAARHVPSRQRDPHNSSTKSLSKTPSFFRERQQLSPTPSVTSGNSQAAMEAADAGRVRRLSPSSIV